MLKKEEVISPLIGGLLEILFFINNLSVFSYIAYKIVHIHSVVVGIILHLIAAIIIGLIGIKVLEDRGIIVLVCNCLRYSFRFSSTCPL
jgi:hypothetical protein